MCLEDTEIYSDYYLYVDKIVMFAFYKLIHHIRKQYNMEISNIKTKVMTFEARHSRKK